jgi:gas vesicle protein
MIEMSDKDAGSFAIGFLIGAITGVAIGFLYAPKAGKETRALLKEKAEDFREKAEGVAEKAMETATEAGKRVIDKISSKDDK